MQSLESIAPKVNHRTSFLDRINQPFVVETHLLERFDVDKGANIEEDIEM